MCLVRMMPSDDLSSDDLTGIAQKAARGGTFLLIGYFSSTVILAVGSIIIARLLGPSSYGSYSLAVTIPLLLISLADVGMNSALVRFPAKLRSEGDLSRSNRMIRIAFLFKFCTSMAASFICYSGAKIIAVSILNRSELAPLVQLASALILFKAVYECAAYSFIGLDLMQFSAGIQILESIVKSFLAPLLILIGFGVAGALLGYWFSFAVAGVVGTLLLFVRCTRSAGGASNSLSMELRVLLSYSLPLYVTIVLAVFLTQYQNIVLAHFASDLEIGNFNAASNFNMLLMILGYPLGAMFPMFSKLDPRSRRNELTKAFELSVKYASFLIIPGSVATMVLSRDLVSVVYGGSYVLAPSYLVAISSTFLLTALGYLVITSFLNGVGDTTTVLKMNIFALAVFLPLGPALAWSWSVLGLVVAYVLANAVGILYGMHRSSVNFGARPNFGASVKTLVAAFASAIPTMLLLRVYPIGLAIVSFAVGGLLYLIVYLTLAPLLGALNRADVGNLETIFYKISYLSTIAKPILRYESWVLAAAGRD